MFPAAGRSVYSCAQTSAVERPVRLRTSDLSKGTLFEDPLAGRSEPVSRLRGDWPQLREPWPKARAAEPLPRGEAEESGVRQAPKGASEPSGNALSPVYMGPSTLRTCPYVGGFVHPAARRTPRRLTRFTCLTRAASLHAPISSRSCVRPGYHPR
jgi:hypothetical protein